MGKFGIILLFVLNIIVWALFAYGGYKIYSKIKAESSTSQSNKFIKYSKITLISLWILSCVASFAWAVFVYFRNKSLVESISLFFAYGFASLLLYLLLFLGCIFVAYTLKSLLLAKGGFVAALVLGGLSLVIFIAGIVGGILSMSGIGIFIGFLFAIINFCLFGYLYAKILA